MAAQISDPYAAAAPIENRSELRTNAGGTLAQTDPTSPLRRTTEGEDLKRRYLAEQERIRRLVLQRHFALRGSAASVLGTLQRGLITFATH